VKTFLLTISLLFSSLPFAYSQSYYAQNGKGLPCHHLTGAGVPKLTSEGIDSSNLFIDYYLSDSLLYTPNYVGLQGQLLNSYYKYPADTLNSYKGKSMFFMNYDCINSIAVAFDSLVVGSKGYSADTIAGIQLDTLYIPIIQVHNSAYTHYDTLEIQLISVDGDGYPVFGSLALADTLIIADTIGAGNDSTIYTIKWNLSSLQLLSTKFAVNITYYDSTKQDSCWFIYGYGSFSSHCAEEGSKTIFADNTNFSNIPNNIKDFKANSFAFWNGLAGYGYLPTSNGNNVFYPCNAADTDHFVPGIDGANYLQNIDIAADVFLSSYTGISNLHSPGISIRQNYPNPYNNTTNIGYSLVKSADISLKIVDLAGREVFSQSYGTMASGQHSIVLNANTFSAGVYFYSITSSGYTVTKKMEVY
jgi:hypothetical protein